MEEFKSSLLREKFTIRDLGAGSSDDEKPVVALSNRMVVELEDTRSKTKEIFVVRAHNMHSCVRMAAKILHSFKRNGLFSERASPYEWDKAWDSVLNDYERDYNPARWIAVYNKGRAIFEEGDRHALLDVIEKFDSDNSGEYEMSIPMAEDAFKQTGKEVSIDYDGNVALAVHFEEDHGRCAIILRGADRTRTFTFTAAPKDDRPFREELCLNAAAAFLEGIQMAFMVGMNEEKMNLGILDRKSDEGKQTKEAKIRLNRLNTEIANLELACEVRYRPERPEFHHIVLDAEEVARGIFGDKDAAPS